MTKNNKSGIIFIESEREVIDMESDLKIIRENRVEKYAIEYIRLNRQEEELQKQNKLTDELFKMFENKKKELVNNSYTYHKELEEKMIKDMNRIIDDMDYEMSIPTCVEDYM